MAELSEKAGVTVTVDGTSADTVRGGGYSIEVASGTHTVTCTGGDFVGTARVSVTVGTVNREVDCVSGDTGAWVDFVYEVPEPGAVAGWLAAVAGLGAWARGRRAT